MRYFNELNSTILVRAETNNIWISFIDNLDSSGSEKSGTVLNKLAFKQILPFVYFELLHIYILAQILAKRWLLQSLNCRCRF